MFRLIPKYTGRHGIYVVNLYYKSTFLKTLSPNNFKEIDGHKYIEFKNENGSVAIFYDNSVSIGKEKPVIAVTDPSAEGLQKAIKYFSIKEVTA